MSIGYACLAIGVPGSGLSRCILKNASEEKLRAITMKNLSALDILIDYNYENKIKLFRISSDIIPFGSHPINQLRWWEDYEDRLQQLGEKITKAGIRVTMHPGQYTVLNSPNPKVVQKATQELEYHDRFLSSLGMEEKSKLVLHIGGVYGEKKRAMKTFVSNYELLSEKIKRRLIIENDEKSYHIEDVLQISRCTGAPVVFDNLHHQLNQPGVTRADADWIKLCSHTWSARDGKQKIHYSQQKDGGSLGSHSDTIVLSQFQEYYKLLPDPEIDIMLEVKDKNLSAVKCIHGVDCNSSTKILFN